jgi:hypothetical protein
MLLFSILTQITYSRTVVAQDNDNVQIEYLENGDYLVTTITEQPSLTNTFGISLYSEPTTVTKSKTKKYYNKYNNVIWYLKVTGTFTYGHGYAQCTKSVATCKSNSNLWKLTNKKASKAGNIAMAYVKANLYKSFLATKPVRIIEQYLNLECSTTGKFK